MNRKRPYTLRPSDGATIPLRFATLQEARRLADGRRPNGDPLYPLGAILKGPEGWKTRDSHGQWSKGWRRNHPGLIEPARILHAILLRLGLAPEDSCERIHQALAQHHPKALGRFAGEIEELRERILLAAGGSADTQEASALLSRIADQRLRIRHGDAGEPHLEWMRPKELRSLAKELRRLLKALRLSASRLKRQERLPKKPFYEVFRAEGADMIDQDFIHHSERCRTLKEAKALVDGRRPNGDPLYAWGAFVKGPKGWKRGSGYGEWSEWTRQHPDLRVRAGLALQSLKSSSGILQEVTQALETPPSSQEDIQRTLAGMGSAKLRRLAREIQAFRRSARGQSPWQDSAQLVIRILDQRLKLPTGILRPGPSEIEQTLRRMSSARLERLLVQLRDLRKSLKLAAFSVKQVERLERSP